jgi:hypothetical protein
MSASDDEFGPMVPVAAGDDEFGPVVPLAAPEKRFDPRALGASGLDSKAESALHGAVEGIPFGQKLVAGGASGTLRLLKALSDRGIGPKYWQNLSGTSYDEQLAGERDKLARSEKEHGGYTLGGKMVGGGLSMAAMSPFAAGDLALATPEIATAAKLLAAGGNAGLYGAAHGAGQGDTLGESLQNAAVEGPASALFGVAGQAAGDAIGPAFRYVGDKTRDFANARAVKATFPMLADYRGLAAQGRIQPMGEALRESGVVSGVPFRNGGSGAEGTLARAKALRTSEGAQIGRFLDDVSNMQFTRENSYPIQAARHGVVPQEVETIQPGGWSITDEPGMVQNGQRNSTGLTDRRAEIPGTVQRLNMTPNSVVKSTEMVPGVVGYEPEQVLERTIVDKFAKKPLIERLKKELGPKYSGMGQTSLGKQLNTLIKEAQGAGGTEGDIPFSVLNSEKGKLYDSINYNNVAEHTLNALKKDVGSVTNAEMERQAEAMLQANGTPPEAFTRWLKHKEMFGHAQGAVDTLSDHLSRQEANNFVAPYDAMSGLTGALAAYQHSHNPVASAAVAAALAGGSKIARTRGSAMMSSLAGSLADGARYAPELAASLGRSAPNMTAAASRAMPAAFEAPTMQFASGPRTVEQSEEEMRMRALLAALGDAN